LTPSATQKKMVTPPPSATLERPTSKANPSMMRAMPNEMQ